MDNMVDGRGKSIKVENPIKKVKVNPIDEFVEQHKEEFNQPENIDNDTQRKLKNIRLEFESKYKELEENYQELSKNVRKENFIKQQQIQRILNNISSECNINLVSKIIYNKNEYDVDIIETLIDDLIYRDSEYKTWEEKVFILKQLINQLVMIIRNKNISSRNIQGNAKLLVEVIKQDEN